MITVTPGVPLSASAQPQAGALTVTPHASTVIGDLVIVLCSVADTASSSYSMSGGTGGWTTVLASSPTGTAKTFIFSKPFASGDSTYTLTRTGSDAYRVVPLTVHGWDSAIAPIVGAYGPRGASSANTTAPSITTTVADSVVLYLAMERSAANDNAPTINNGFSTVFDAHTVGGDNLQAVYVASKSVATPGAVGATTATFTNSNTNSGAILLGIAPGVSAPPTTGQIGARVATSVTHDTVTMGVDRIGGTVVEIAVKAGTTELARLTPSIDGSSGWGHATFTGLAPDTAYGFDFYVDGALQTDTAASIRTHPTLGTPTNFTFVAGSCQFTGSNHPVWDRIREENARGLAHMGDLHYDDATTATAWRAGVEASLTAARLRALLGTTPMTWTWDNHDRIMTNPAGGGTAVNLGETDPVTNTEWRRLAGTTGWASSDTAGRSWVIGRVRFIQTDQWTMRDDADGDPSPRTFMGAAQKQWFKDTLDAATEPVIVWLCQWTGQNHANGRWDSFPEETTELESFINARPGVKSRLVMIGGDSHSLQVTDGSRTLAQGQRFAGIRNYNISGFNRSSDTGSGSTGWLVDQPLRTSAQPEADWGGYSRITVDDDGAELTFLWEGVRVGPDGTTDVMASQTIIVASTAGSGVLTVPALTASGTGSTTVPSSTGTAAAVLSTVQASGVGTRTVPVFSGAGAAVLPALQAVGLGAGVPPVFVAVGALPLPPLGAAGAGAIVNPVGFVGAGVLTLPGLSASGVGGHTVPAFSGAGAAELVGLEASGTGSATPPPAGAGSLLLPALVLSGVGHISRPASRMIFTVTGHASAAPRVRPRPLSPPIWPPG